MYHKPLRKPGGNVQINKYELAHKKRQQQNGDIMTLKTQRMTEAS